MPPSAQGTGYRSIARAQVTKGTMVGILALENSLVRFFNLHREDVPADSNPSRRLRLAEDSMAGELP